MRISAVGANPDVKHFGASMLVKHPLPGDLDEFFHASCFMDGYYTGI
jgi:hypothetical protein